MTASEALRVLRNAASAGTFFLSDHAVERMEERAVERQDIRHALMAGNRATWQPKHKTWLVTGGTDLDGGGLNVACILREGVCVATIF